MQTSRGLFDVAKIGATWTLTARFVSQGIAFLSTVILARKIAPAAYGTMGMAQLAIGLVGLLRDMGLGTAIVQKRDLSAITVATIFWLNVGTSVIVASLCLAAAPIASRFFREPLLGPVLVALSIALFLSNLATFPAAMLQRDLRFRPLALIDIGSAIAGLVVAVTLTYFYQSTVWILVALNITTSFFGTAALFVAATYVPAFRFSWSSAVPLVRFGAYLSGSTVVTYFSRNTDNILIGRFLGPTPLSYYQFAYNLMTVPLNLVSNVVSRVLFPAICAMQGDEMIRRAYVRACSCIAAITFPLMAGMWVTRQEFTLTVLGPRWLPVVPLIAILAPVGFVQSVLVTVGVIYTAKGRTDLLFRWGTVFSILLIISFIVGLPWGVKGVALSYACMSFILFVPTLKIPSNLIGLRTMDFVAAMLPQLSASIALVLGVMIIRSLVSSRFQLPVPILFVVLVIVGACIYFGVLIGLKAAVLNDIKRIMKKPDFAELVV